MLKEKSDKESLDILKELRQEILSGKYKGSKNKVTRLMVIDELISRINIRLNANTKAGKTSQSPSSKRR